LARNDEETAPGEDHFAVFRFLSSGWAAMLPENNGKRHGFPVRKIAELGAPLDCARHVPQIVFWCVAAALFD